MAGAAAARTLTVPDAETHPAAHAARRFVYRLAGPADDNSLRRLLRENPFDGAIRLSLECEPDGFAAAGIYGPVHQVLVARERRSGHLVAMACRAERDVFVNGRVQRLGYLGQLRVDARMRRQPRLLADGFAFCRALHDSGGVPAYLVSVVEDNGPAMRLLTAGRLADQPALTPCDDLITFAVPVRQGLFSRTRPTPGPQIEPGRRELLASIVDCLQRNGARHQFAPVWTAGDLLSAARTPGLRLDDFLVVVERGRVTACAACWDQRAFRQTVVRGYTGWLSRTRILVNLAGPLVGTPRLPPVGSMLSFAFLSHLAVDDDDLDAGVQLIRSALAIARHRGLQYLVLGLAARHPLAAIVARRFRHRQYVSRLYLARWADGDAFVRAIDARIPHPEVAVL